MIEKVRRPAVSFPLMVIKLPGPAIIAACLFMSAGYAHGDDVYKYKDERGVIHIVQDPDQVPERYRKSLQKVGGHVSVMKRGDASTDGRDRTGVLESIRGSGSSGSEGPVSLAGIIFYELWRSRLILISIGALVLMALLPFGLVMTRDVPHARQRKVFQVMLPVSCLSALIFLWLGLAGPSMVRFFRGCEEGSHQALNLAGFDSDRRQSLVRFRDACSRWAEKAEKAVMAPES